MQTYTLDRSGASPLYEQLYRALKADILSGALPGGSRLPSGRALPVRRRISTSSAPCFQNSYASTLTRLTSTWLMRSSASTGIIS